MIKDMLNSFANGTFIKGSAVLGIATFAVIMIRNAHKDSKELQLKLDELIAAMDKVSNDPQNRIADNVPVRLQKSLKEQNYGNDIDDEEEEETITYYRYK